MVVKCGVKVRTVSLTFGAMDDVIRSNGEEIVAKSIKSKIRPEVLKEVLRSKFKDPKTKINDDALVMMSELIRTTVVEISLRGCRQAKLEGSNTVEMEHIEKNLPQMMLDIP